MKARLAAAALCASMALCLSGTRIRAQSAPQTFGDSADERGAYEDYRANHLLTARTKAERALRVNEDSIVGNYVMGVVMHEAEGLPARAIHYLARARAVYETRYGTSRPPGAPWRLHEEILYATQRLAGELEEHEFRLQMLQYHDALYDPPLLSQQALTLMRLGRFTEARQKAQEAARSTDAEQRLTAQNALCAIETEARQRQPRYAACTVALEQARRRPTEQGETSPRIAVYAYNAAQAAYSTLHYEEVERFAQEATRRIEFTPANPHRLLARLYLDSGRMTDAIGSIREMQRWRAAQPAYLRDQDRAESDSMLATLLLVGGEPEIGLRLVDRAIERPDRRGLVSSKPEQALGAHALLRRTMLRMTAEIAAERASYTPGFAFAARGESIARTARAAVDDERVVSVLADEERLESTLRVYVGGGLEPISSWMVGDLVNILGTGVFAVALSDAMGKDGGDATLRPYHESLQAELALARGDYAEATRLARSSAAALPRWEALLAARTLAVGAEAARRGGDDSAARALFEQVMTKDAGVIRRMGLSLPATVRVGAGSNAVSEQAARWLRGSPRLRDDSQGFIVAIDRAGNGWNVCLRTPQGNQVTCVPVAAPARGESEEQSASRLCATFHREVFASRAGFATIDLRSLDGTTTSGRDNSREQLRGLIDQVDPATTAPETTR